MVIAVWPPTKLAELAPTLARVIQACGIRARLGRRISNLRRNFKKTRSNFQARFPGPLPITIISKGPENRTVFWSCFLGRFQNIFLHSSSSFGAGFGLLLVLRLGSCRWRAAFNMEGRRPLAGAAMHGASRSSSTKLFCAFPRVGLDETCMLFPPDATRAACGDEATARRGGHEHSSFF